MPRWQSYTVKEISGLTGLTEVQVRTILQAAVLSKQHPGVRRYGKGPYRVEPQAYEALFSHLEREQCLKAQAELEALLDRHREALMAKRIKAQTRTQHLRARQVIRLQKVRRRAPFPWRNLPHLRIRQQVA